MSTVRVTQCEPDFLRSDGVAVVGPFFRKKSENLEAVAKTFPGAFPSKLEFFDDGQRLCTYTFLQFLAEGQYGSVASYGIQSKENISISFPLRISLKSFFDQSEAHLEQKIAMKLNKCNQECAHVVRFRWVAHPNEEDHGGWLAMSYLDGTLLDFLSKSPSTPNTAKKALHMLEDIGQGLLCAQDFQPESCVAYTDLKFENVMFRRNKNGSTEGVLVDIGGFFDCSADTTYVSTFQSPQSYHLSTPGDVGEVDVALLSFDEKRALVQHQSAFSLWAMALTVLIRTSDDQAPILFLYTHANETYTNFVEQMPSKAALFSTWYAKNALQFAYKYTNSIFPLGPAVAELCNRSPLSHYALDPLVFTLDAIQRAVNTIQSA